MFDCTTDTYEALYARWLARPGALLEWGGFDPKKHRLLDLCGGTGAISLEALRRGAKRVWLLDLNPRCKDLRVCTLRGRAEDLCTLDFFDPLLPTDGHRRQEIDWNFVVCRQALGYLDLAKTARALYCSMEKGGAFVCNAFVRPKWSAQTYVHEGRRYVEASGFLGKKVFHLQAMRGDFDVTAFRWYSTHDIVSAFAPTFSLEHFDETSVSLRFLFKRK